MAPSLMERNIGKDKVLSVSLGMNAWTETFHLWRERPCMLSLCMQHNIYMDGHYMTQRDSRNSIRNYAESIKSLSCSRHCSQRTSQSAPASSSARHVPPAGGHTRSRAPASIQAVIAAVANAPSPMTVEGCHTTICISSPLSGSAAPQRSPPLSAAASAPAAAPPACMHSE